MALLDDSFGFLKGVYIDAEESHFFHPSLLS